MHFELEFSSNRFAIVVYEWVINYFILVVCVTSALSVGWPAV